MAGIFGASVPEVMQAAQINRLRKAQMIGSMGPGGHGALAGLNLARGVGGLFGAQDPMLRQAQEMSQIQQELAQTGARPGTPQYTQALTARVRMRLGEVAAIQAFQQATELEKQALGVKALRQKLAPTNPQLIEFRRRVMLANGATPEEADVGAFDEKFFLQFQDDAREGKKIKKSDLQRRLEFAFPDDPEAQRGMASKILAQQARGSGTSVNVINAPSGFAVDPQNPNRVIAIPGGPQDPSRVSPAEAKENRSAARSLDVGISAADALLARLQGGVPVMGAAAKEANLLRGDVFAALAAMRNLGVLQPGEIAFLQSQIPEASGIWAKSGEKFLGLDSITGPLQLFRQRAIEARKRLRLPEAERAQPSGNQRLRYNPQTGKLE